MTSLDFCTYPDYIDTGGVCTNRSCRARDNRDDRIAELEAEIERLREERDRYVTMAENAHMEGVAEGIRCGLKRAARCLRRRPVRRA